MKLEYLLVTFKEKRVVIADDEPVGLTNVVLMLEPGGYEIALEGGGTNPASQDVVMIGTSIRRPKIVSFS